MIKLFFMYILYWMCFPVILIVEMVTKNKGYNRVQFAIDIVFFGRPDSLKWALLSQAKLETGNFASNFYVTHNNCFGMSAIGDKGTWLLSKDGRIAQFKVGKPEQDGGKKAMYFNVIQSVFDMRLWLDKRAYNPTHPTLKANDLIEAQLKSNSNEPSSKFIYEYGQTMLDFRFNPSPAYSTTLYKVAQTTDVPKLWCTILVIIAGLVVTGLEFFVVIYGFKKAMKRKRKKKGVSYGKQ